MRKTITSLFVAALVFLPVVAATGHANAATTKHVHTIVIGDSITRYGTPYLLAMRPNWVIDGVPGRDVDQMPRRIAANLKAHGIPKNIVLALGQNAVDGWTRTSYRDAVNMMPKTVNVFLVTTYRDPGAFGEGAAKVQETYSHWMREIASTHANVHIINWRGAVKAGTAVLMDGSHPDEPSRQVWAEMVRDKVAEVDAAAAA